MKKFIIKYRFTLIIVVLIVAASAGYVFLNVKHYTFGSREECKNCHLQDGDLLFVNAEPGVKYTGSESCKECHKDVYHAYMNTQTGHSMSRMMKGNVIEKFPQDYPVFDPVKNYYYEMLEKDGKFYQREYRLSPDKKVVHERWMEAQYIIGSGSNLRIYFYNENGMFYELPLTWYVHKGKWDLSPGYRVFDNNRFSRYVGTMCFSCHNGHMEKIKEANERYKGPIHLGIGCEDCHGPGELHIKQFKNELPALPGYVNTTVNPAKLSPVRRNDVCLQCHIEGKSWALNDNTSWFDFRPGMHLEDQRSVYTSSKQTKHTFLVSDTGNRMFLSLCFSGSHGQLTCDFCHPSHKTYEVDKVKYNRQSCLKCHPIEGLPMREARLSESREDCNRCHMNKAPAENTLHGVIDTDHWIRINSDLDRVNWVPERSHKEKLVLTPVVDKPDSASELRHGIAYAEYYFNEDRSIYYLDSAYYYLFRGLKLAPKSINGNFYLGKVERLLKKYTESENHLKYSAELYPDNSNAFYELALLYKEQKKYPNAIATIKQAIEIKKLEPTYMELLGSLYYDADSLLLASDVLGRSIKIDSQNPNVFFMLGNIAVFKENNPQKALGYFKTAVELNPDLPDALINLGNTYALLGNLDKAVDAYQRELLFRKNSVKAYQNLRRIYEIQGKHKDSEEILKKAKGIGQVIK